MYLFKRIRLLLMALLFFSCKSDHATSFAIRDFKKTLQPCLLQIVSTGIVGFDSATTYLENHATDEDLVQLSRSEHPILRAVAFRILLDRPTINHFDLIMNHLDDTALVVTDKGEFGYGFRTVSDDLIEHGRWKDTSARTKTIVEIILKHNYLRTAYTGLSKIELTEKYYASIKQMVQRERLFEETEDALYALAGFKKPEDVQLIRKILISRNYRMSARSFNLLKDFPDESYMQVFTKYYPANFYHFICEGEASEKVEAFFNALASYKSVNSLRILKAILTRKPFMKYACFIDTNDIKEKLYYAIRNNDCPAYAPLRKEVAVKIKEIEASQLQLSIDPWPITKDTASEPVRWW